MKFIIVVCALVACSLADKPTPEELKQKALETIRVCKEENELSDDVAKKLTFGDFSVRDEKAQCFVRCFFKRSGFLDDNDVMQPEVIIQKLAAKGEGPTEKLKEIVDKCVAEKGATACERAFNTYECYRNAFPFKKQN